MRAFLAGVLIVAAGACGDVNTTLARQNEARQLAADLLLKFTTAADASNRAVMASTDDASVALAREARSARETIDKDLATLAPLLGELGHTDEARLLQEFQARYAEYRALDDRILDLTVENSNLKAQRLSFGPALEAADQLRDAVNRAAASAKDRWRAGTHAAAAVAAVREIQALQAPHIAEPNDEPMTRLEARMMSAERDAREALAGLAASAPNGGAAAADATAALDRFMAVHADIIGLSRRNTNVRSLALTLDDKRKLIAPCEQSLRALRAALAKRGYPAGRTS